MARILGLQQLNIDTDMTDPIGRVPDSNVSNCSCSSSSVQCILQNEFVAV